MAGDTVKTPRRRTAEAGALAGAVAAALAVGLWLLISGGSSNGGGSAEDAVRRLYAAATAGDAAAFAAILAPTLRDDPAGNLVAFASSLGEIEIGGTGVGKPAVSGLKTQLLEERPGWATVRATGTVAFAGEQKPLDETLYLQQSGTAWYVSTQTLFLEAFTTPQPGKPGGQKLGPLGPDRPKVGEPAPDFALLDARDGTTVRKLSDFRGKAVVVNWYASWCKPCRSEIPEFLEAEAAAGGQVVFFGVDYLEDREAAVSILDDLKATYPAVLDSEGSVAEQYRVSQGLPVTFFIDRDGVLRAFHTGQLTKAELKANLALAGVALP